MTCYMEVYAQRAAMKASFASIQQESAANRGTERRAVRTAVVNTGDLLEDEKVEDGKRGVRTGKRCERKMKDT